MIAPQSTVVSKFANIHSHWHETAGEKSTASEFGKVKVGFAAECPSGSTPGMGTVIIWLPITGDAIPITYMTIPGESSLDLSSDNPKQPGKGKTGL